MSIAGRPTFHPARGRVEKDLSVLSNQYSARDLPGLTKLKYRKSGQGTRDELLSRDFRKELEEREGEVCSGSTKSLKSSVRKAIEAINSKLAKQHHEPQAPTNLAADDPLDNDSSDSDAVSDDEDDAAALLAELNKIKNERLQEASLKEQEKEHSRMENILSGNPLINYEPRSSTATASRNINAVGAKGELRVKRRWDDDVVFKNCARSAPNKKTRFINDGLRTDFHKKFMDKYIK